MRCSQGSVLRFSRCFIGCLSFVSIVLHAMVAKKPNNYGLKLIFYICKCKTMLQNVGKSVCYPHNVVFPESQPCICNTTPFNSYFKTNVKLVSFLSLCDDIVKGFLLLNFINTSPFLLRVWWEFSPEVLGKTKTSWESWVRSLLFSRLTQWVKLGAWPPFRMAGRFS